MFCLLGLVFVLLLLITLLLILLKSVGKLNILLYDFIFNFDVFVSNHVIHVDDSGLVTIVGGKWTTYRYINDGLACL